MPEENGRDNHNERQHAQNRQDASDRQGTVARSAYNGLTGIRKGPDSIVFVQGFIDVEADFLRVLFYEEPNVDVRKNVVVAGFNSAEILRVDPRPVEQFFEGHPAGFTMCPQL